METLYSDNDITITETTITTTSGKTLQMHLLNGAEVKQGLTKKGAFGSEWFIGGIGMMGMWYFMFHFLFAEDQRETIIGTITWWLMVPVGFGMTTVSIFLRDVNRKGDAYYLHVRIGDAKQLLLNNTDRPYVDSLAAIINQQLEKMQTETSSES